MASPAPSAKARPRAPSRARPPDRDAVPEETCNVIACLSIVGPRQPASVTWAAPVVPASPRMVNTQTLLSAADLGPLHGGKRVGFVAKKRPGSDPAVEPPPAAAAIPPC